MVRIKPRHMFVLPMTGGDGKAAHIIMDTRFSHKISQRNMRPVILPCHLLTKRMEHGESVFPCIV